MDVYALLGSELRGVKKVIEKVADAAGQAASVRDTKLMLQRMRGVRAGGRSDLVVLCHYNEGRLLLTDRDGLYNDLLCSAARASGGNVVVVLTGVKTEAGALASAGLLEGLVGEGAQASVGAIAAQGRLLTWERKPSSAQLEQLRRALAGELPPLSVPEGLLRHGTLTRGLMPRGGGDGKVGFLCGIL